MDDGNGVLQDTNDQHRAVVNPTLPKNPPLPNTTVSAQKVTRDGHGTKVHYATAGDAVALNRPDVNGPENVAASP
jgi:hypothetical protein